MNNQLSVQFVNEFELSTNVPDNVGVIIETKFCEQGIVILQYAPLTSRFDLIVQIEFLSESRVHVVVISEVFYLGESVSKTLSDRIIVSDTLLATEYVSEIARGFIESLLIEPEMPAKVAGRIFNDVVSANGLLVDPGSHSKSDNVIAL